MSLISVLTCSRSCKQSPKQDTGQKATPLLHPLQHSRTLVGTHEKRAQTDYNQISPTTEISAYTIKIIVTRVQSTATK